MRTAHPARNKRNLRGIMHDLIAKNNASENICRQKSGLRLLNDIFSDIVYF